MGSFNYYRKSWHLLGFIIPLIYYYDIFNGVFGLANATRAIIFTFLLAFILILILVDFIRLRVESFNRLFFKVFSLLLKEEESERMNATLPYMVANAIVVLLFPAEIYFLSMAFLLIGDPFAAFFGSKYGNLRFSNGKSLVGIIAFVLSSFLVGLFLLYFFSLIDQTSVFSLFHNDKLNILAFALLCLGSVSAGLAEFFSGHGLGGFLDDNLTIPLVSAMIMVLCAILVFNIESDLLFFDPIEIYSK